MLTSSPNCESLDELILRAERITICGLRCPMQFIEVKTGVDLFGDWDNNGHKRCLSMNYLPEVSRLATRYGKSICYERESVNIKPIIDRMFGTSSSE